MLDIRWTKIKKLSFCFVIVSMIETEMFGFETLNAKSRTHKSEN